MNLYEYSTPILSKSLANLEAWIDKAQAHATAKKFDANVLLQQRLAPDMYPLVRQVQSVCDTAKFICARLAGKDAPSHPDTETTWDELRTRIRSVREYVSSFKPADFEGGDTRKVTLSFLPGKFMYGKDYILEMALPNLYFHLVTAYSILRHNGVDLGKMDFISSLTLHDA